MAVVINEFEVVGNEQEAPERGQRAEGAPPPAPRPLSPRELARRLKFWQERARRLHAD